MKLNKILKFNQNSNWLRVILINKVSFLIISNRIKIYLIYFKNQSKTQSEEANNSKWAKFKVKNNRNLLIFLILIKNSKINRIFCKYKKLELLFKKMLINLRISNLVPFIRKMCYLRFQSKTLMENSFFHFKYDLIHKWDLLKISFKNLQIIIWKNNRSKTNFWKQLSKRENQFMKKRKNK